MASYPSIIKNFDGFIDGQSYAGKIEEAELPDIGLETEEQLAGGMAGTVDVSMGALEKMEAAIMINGMSSDMMKQLGRADGQLTARGALGAGGVTTPAIFQMRGLFKKVETGSMKRKDKGSTKLLATLTYLKVTIDGEEIVEVDVMGGRFIVGGVDRFAADRAALGQF